MTPMISSDVASIQPIGHREAMALQAAELQRGLALLRTLDPHQWSAQTNCPDWDVRLMWIHVLGACEAGASVRENLHQLRAGLKRRKDLGVPLEAGLSGFQVAEREHLSPTEIVERLERVAPKTVKGRTRIPRLIRAIKFTIDAPVVEKWALGYLIDILYLRDAWMHRVDAAQAVGSEVVLTAEHDGRIVADIVADWARRHGKPFALELTGTAGGTFSAGGGDEPIVVDAVEFCCRLSGRGEATGLLTTIVPF